MFAKLPSFAKLCRTPSCLVLCLVCKIFISRHIRQVSLIRQLSWHPYCFMLCPVGECGKIVLLTIFAKFTRFAGVYEPPDCLVLCIVGECGKTVVFAIFVKFSNIFSFLPFLLLRAFLTMSHNRPTELSACSWPYS